MKLIYLRETNLKDRVLVRDIIINFKLSDKVLLIHDTFGSSVEDTKFVTKRLSSLFSESMIYNNAFLAEQRGFFVKNGEKLSINSDLIHHLLQTVQLLIIGPVIKDDGTSVLGSAMDMIHTAIQELNIEEVILFPDHPRSPLVAQKVKVENQDIKEKLLKLYDEEQETIEMGHLLEATIASPMNYAK